MHELPAIAGLEGYSFFLDFDGTITSIAGRPELAVLPAATADIIIRLRQRLSGALAIISGRDIASIDRYFSPHVLPVAGVHGVLRRDAAGRMIDALAPGMFDDGVSAEARAATACETGVLIEAKRGAVAIHYRGAPEAEPLCRSAAWTIAARRPELHVLEGKMLYELKPRGYGKGAAIRAFMSEPPFANRRPVFVGDDLTDEDGFHAVNGLGGIAIKVGAGATAAPFRVSSSAALVAWLGMLAG
jgi:trehalose 6-phosphate phosphatase